MKLGPYGRDLAPRRARPAARPTPQKDSPVACMPSNAEILLQPIRSRRLSQIVVDQITGLIEEGRLTVGDQLPSERQLVQQLGISRASVREALRLLESQGLVEVLGGKGAFVVGAVSKANALPGLMVWLEEHHEEVLDVLEVRAILESHAAYLGAQRGSPQMVVQLRDVVTEMISCVEQGGLVDATRADRKFHHLLYEASGNRFLKLLGDGIVATLFGPRYSTLRIPGRAQQSAEEHRLVMEAIAARDPEAASKAIRQHLSSVRDLILDIEGET